MDRPNVVRAPEYKGEHPGDEIIHCTEETCEGTGPFPTPAERVETGTVIGHEKGGLSLLYSMCLDNPLHALSSFLHEVDILEDQRASPGGCTW